MLEKMKNGLIYRAKGFWGGVNRYFYKSPVILSTEDSIQRIIKTRCSVARFGDGEFNLIRGVKLGFQDADQGLSERLLEVLQTPRNDLEIGIPDVFGSLSAYSLKSARFWKAYMGMHRGELIRLINLNRVYLNANMTRFWSGYQDKARAVKIAEQFRKIWRGRNVVFVEGELTRMGVGNDLFSEAASIRRVLCPETNAWNSYSKILNTITKCDFNQNTLFILALGPTATVLAYDLTAMGYQALDLGHLDVQYEYCRLTATEKVALQGKYVNENVDGRVVSDSIVDGEYLESIVARIN